MVDFSKLRGRNSGAFVVDVLPPSPEVQEQVARSKLYERALEELVQEDRMYVSNRNIFDRWQLDMKIWWINDIERQAKEGKDTIGTRVVARAIMLRLENV